MASQRYRFVDPSRSQLPPPHPSERPTPLRPSGAPDEADDDPQDTAPTLRAPPPASDACPGPERTTSGSAEAVDPRRAFAALYQELPEPERVAAARSSDPSALVALCADPAPAVAQALLGNAHLGLQHARWLARYHGSSAGLEALSRRAAFVQDAQTRWSLLKNSALPRPALLRLLQARAPLELFQLSISHELPERTRTEAHQMFRRVFPSVSAEQRAAVVLQTEGRCLKRLSGCSWDARTTQLLEARATTSMTLAVNLARFPGTPAPLVARLSNCPLPKRNPSLATLLRQHPSTR